jgi:hypothetical protein
MIRQTNTTTPAADVGGTDCRDTSPDPYAGRLLLIGAVSYAGLIICICVIALGVWL